MRQGVSRPGRTDVLYCEGPGDIVAAYRSWARGEDHASETSVTFSGQVFEFCRTESLSLLALSYCEREDRWVNEECEVANLPRHHLPIPKIGYGLSLLAYAVRLLGIAFVRRPKVIFITSGVVGWTACALLQLSGARIVPILHNTLWTQGHRARGVAAQLRDRGHQWTWQHFVAATLVVSPVARRQVEAISGSSRAPIIEFRPSFPADSFPVDLEAKPFDHRPFAVLYSGRIEENKGVFDLLSAAESLNRKSPGAVEFHFCGAGSAFDRLRATVEAANLGGVVFIHGRLARRDLVQHYLQAHVVVVPTRSSFGEGFAQVVAEALLLLRPVITNSNVPAAEVFAKAVVLATTDSSASYAERIESLSRDRTRYEQLVEEARKLRPDLLNESASFLASLRRVKLELAL